MNTLRFFGSFSAPLGHLSGVAAFRVQWYNITVAGVITMKFKQIIKDMSLVVIGNFILAAAVGIFILPYNILSGGVAGIAVELAPITHISAEVWINILIIGLFIVGSMFLGRKFAFHTATSSFIYPLFLTYISSCHITTNIDPMLASLYGGLLAGIGVGCVFRTGASTGGMDVPPLVINKYTGIAVSKLVLAVDAVTVTLGMFVFGLEPVLIGFISVWACSFALDKVMLFGAEDSKSVMIISNYYPEIIQAIHDKLDRGTTVLDGHGGFTGDDRQVILSVILKNQYPELIKLVSNIDSDAFMIVTEAYEVKGNGFSFDYKV